MTELLHPAASQHLPSFITAPGETDVLMVAMSLILLLAVLGVGVLFFRLHTMPERMAHRSHKVQFEIVAVLGLLALFTHIHLFWVAGLLLAFIDFPDFGGWLGRIARSVEKIAGIKPAESDADHETIAGTARGDGGAEMPPETTVGRPDGTAAAAGSGKRKEPIHA